MSNDAKSPKNDGIVRVLIVDDNPSFRRELRLFLESSGDIKVIGEAENGLRGVELTERRNPDVVLMDQNMPSLSGVEATKRIKASRPQTRVIFIAAEERWEKSAVRAGAERFFLKEDDLGELLQIIQDPLGSLRPRIEPKPQPKIGNLLANKWLWRALGGLCLISYLAALITSMEMTLVLTALFFGIFFFVYGLKYYLSVALILFATSGSGNGNAHGNKNGSLNGRLNGWLNGKRNGKGNGKGINGRRVANGGNGRLPSHLRPFVSIHLPLYNEIEVVDRLLTACTSIDYENYEIIVADDSTDETTQILQERWESHPRVKISHRVDRSGYKGGALKVATQRMDPRAEFVVVFDADFVPPPDILHHFLSYFYGINGSNGNHYDENTTNISLVDDCVAVVQGYQWHMLNASENWITRGVRSEFSGSYVIERSGQEMIGSMKMISGSVFMIRADVLRQIGWKTSITEDWELTLRLYLEGYKVLYTPFIQAPAECVATFAQLTKQRMRWAEGHTFNVKKYFRQVLSSTKINLREKLEFLYYAPYYLQSVLFLLGTGSWLVSDFILDARLPFWTKSLGWSLVFVNAFSLVLMNLSGLFLERGVRRNWKGLLSFVLLTFLLVPYQAYAAIKGLIEPDEGGWHRTQKTGVITEVLGRLGMRRRLRRLRPKKRYSIGLAGQSSAFISKLIERLGFLVGNLADRVGLPTAGLEGLYQRVRSWIRRLIPQPLKRLTRRVGLRARVAFSLAISLLLLIIFSARVLVVSAAPDIFYLRGIATNGASPAGQDMNNDQGSSEDTQLFDSVDDEAYWYTDITYPTGEDDAGIAAGDYTLDMYFDQLPSAWWDTDYLNRQQITVTTTSEAVDAGYSVSLTFNHNTLVSGSQSLASGDDVRIVHLNGSTWTELDRVLDPVSSWNNTSTQIWFSLVDPISASSSDNNYYLYYGNLSASSPPEEWANVFMIGDDFNNGTLTSDIATSTAGTATISETGGEAFIDLGTNELTDAGIIVTANALPSDRQFAIKHKTKLISGGGVSNPEVKAIGVMQAATQPPVETSANENPRRRIIDFQRVDTNAMIFYFDVGALPNSNCWNHGTSSWDVGTCFWGTLSLDTYYIHELISDGTNWYIRVSDAGGSELTTTTTVPWTEVDDPKDTLWFYWGEVYTDYYYANVKSDWVYVRDYVNPEPTTSLGLEEDAPYVKVTVSVHNTRGDGSDPQEIVTYSSLTIDANISDPYTLTIGSGSEQTFTSGDPRRLRVKIDVTAVNGSGSFTLAYDSASAPSSLDTPSITIPGVTVLLLAVVVLIPVLTSLMTRKRRLTVWLLTIILSLIVSLTLLAQQVFPVSAAPDKFYLRDTTTNGASPAGQDMNLIQGSSEDTLLFDATNYLAYWYTDITYPTGEEDASIANGDYTLNMHFDQLPGSTTWWDASYGYRKDLTISAGSSDVPSGYSVSLTFDHESLVDMGYSQSDGDDIAITYWNGSGWVQLDRILDPGSSWNTESTTIWFQTQAAISASSSDSDYDLYYGNPSVAFPPADGESVFYFYDGFESGDLSVWDDIVTGSGDSITVDDFTVHTGGYAAEAYVDDGTQAAVERLFAGEPYMLTSIWVYLPLTYDAGSYIDLVQYYTESATKIASLSLNTSLQPYIENFIGLETYTSDTALTTGAWHNLEMKIKISDTEGKAELWQNGIKKVDEPDIDTGTEDVDRKLAGISWKPAGTGEETIYIDDIFDRLWLPSEPTTNLGLHEVQPSVSLEVTVSHTKPDGTDNQVIVISPIVTINAATPNPYPLEIGSGSLQTFSASDPRILRLRIEVDDTTNNGSFTLAYDSSTKPSSLDTPSLTIFDVTILLLFVAVFIPIVTSLVTRKRRLATWIVSILISLLIALSLLGQQVLPVSAAPDAFYFRDTAVNGASPAGEDMNIAQGSSEDVLVFNTTNQSEYWYTDLTYPTGNDDATLDAGTYTLHMHFDQLPSSTSWWDSNYQYRKKITVTNNDSIQLGTDTIVAFTANTQQLINDSMLRSDGNDWRIVHWTGSGWNEIAQLVEAGWNTTSTETWFRLVDSIDASASDGNYYVYYGYAGEITSPSTFTTSEQELENYTYSDDQSSEAIDYDSTEWGAAQGVQFNVGTSRYWKITRFSFYQNNGSGGSGEVAGFVFDSTNSLEGDEITNGKSGAVATNTFSTYAFNDLSWSSTYPKVKTGVQYYIAILPTTPAGRAASGNYIRWDFDSSSPTYRSSCTNCKAYGVRQDGTWGFFWVPDGSDRTFRVYGREAANDDLAASLGSEQNEGVEIQVTVSHTASDGSGPTTIIQSSVVSIKSDTTSPYDLIIGSGAQQTFTSADERRLRVQIEVVDANDQSFTLAYDSSAKPTNLETPSLTVFDVTLLMVAVVVLIPVVTGVATRKRRLVVRIISVAVSVIVALTLLANQVGIVSAAPDTFYLHDTDTSGISPAGEYMNLTTPTDPTPPEEFPAGPVYRSIGTNTGTIYDTGNASIDSGTTTVTFGGGASLPAPTAVGAVGVGDKLVIGSETFFILSRDSATQVTVQNAATSTHNDASYTITRAYNSFQAWEDPCGATPCLPTSSGGRGGNLAGENRLEVGVAYKDGTFTPTAQTLFEDSTPDANYYMRLTVAPGQRHDGTAGTGVELDGGSIASGHVFLIRDPYVRIEWLEIGNYPGDTVTGQPINVNEGNAGDNYFSHLIIHDYTSTGRGAINIYENVTVRNSIFYSGDTGLRTYSNTLLNATLENVTIYGMTGDGVFHTAGTITVKNTISVGNGDDDFDLQTGTTVSGDSGYNLYSTWEDQQPGSNNQSPPGVLEDLFISLVASSEDLHLEPGGHDAIDNGTSLEGSFTVDIDNQTRPYRAEWDIGADEHTPYMRFDTVDQDVYWYTDLTYPTGGDSGSIAAGDYSLNMYFDKLPATGTSVSITVTVSRTASDGSSATTIVSTSTTIDSSTTSTLDLTIGTGAEQTFDPGADERLQVQIHVDSISGGGSFALAYDTSTNLSSLDTPSMVIPDVTPLLVAVVILIPVVMNLFMKRRRLAMRLASIVISLVAVLAILGQQVLPTSAAPDVFYLHDTVADGTWYDTDWSYRKKITIYASQVSADLDYFPVLINQSSDAELSASAQTDGGDILFTSANGTTKLDHEIEKYISGTGELVAWVEVPSLSDSVNTELYMYYGNATVADQWNINGTWDEGGSNNYQAVWHLDETSGQHYDSTSNGNNSTSVNVTTQGSATGQIDGADEFERTLSNNVVIGGGSESLDITDAITIEAWIDEDAVSDKGRIVTKVSEIYVLRINWDDDLEGYLTINSTLRNIQVDTVDPVIGYVVLTWDGQAGDNKLRLYRNGGQIGETAEGYAGTIDDYDGANDVLYIGSHDSGEYFDGIIDEVRISSTARPVAWIETSYNNQNSPSAFYNLDSQETPGITPSGKEMNNTLGSGAATLIFDSADDEAYWYTDISYPTGSDDASIAAGDYKLNMHFDQLPGAWYDSAWSSRKKLTLDSSMVTDNFTTFPVLVSMTDADLIGNTQADGGDILFTTDNGTTKLDHEIESYNSGTGELVAWVEVTNLSSVSDTDIYMYYDNTGASDQWNINGTWDSNYIGVWHLDESGDGTLNEFKDSTANDNHGTGGKGYSGYLPTQSAGHIGYGQTFDGTNDFIDMASSGWFDANWSYRKRILIQGDEVSGTSDLPNFPVLISFDPNSDNDLKYTGNGGHVGKDDGTDIFFTNDEGAKLDHEIEVYDPATGEFIAWVEATNVATNEDTTIYMYYGYALAADQQNVIGTWDEGGSGDYKGVWHLNEDPTDPAPQFLDSTSNPNEGTAQPVGQEPSQTTGQIDGGLAFDDSNERHVEVAHDTSMQLSTDITVSAWVQTTDAETDVGLIANKWGSASADRNYWLGKLNDTSIAFYVDDTQNVTANLSLINNGSFHYVVGVADVTNSLLRIYVDGSEQNTAAYDGTSVTGTSDFYIGSGSGSTLQEFDGSIDEVRVSSTARSAGWIATEFANQDSPSTFYQVLSEETPSDITLDLTGTEITLEAWVKYVSTASGVDGVMTKNGYADGYRLVMEDANDLTFAIGKESDDLNSDGTISSEPEWHHLVATYDGSIMRIYIDGSPDTATFSQSVTLESAGKEFWIGHGDHAIERAWSYPWHGVLDEVRISNTARTLEWVQTSHYNQDNQGTGAGKFIKTLGSIESAPTVDIVVSVYHTSRDGSDPQPIVTSSTVTIDGNTSDPYELPIGTGALQTFTSADPRLVRVHIDVTAVSGGGSFTLAYDSVADPSSLDTPSMVIPELTILLTALVILIPIMTALLTKKRRLTIRLMSIVVSLIFALSLLSRQVLPTSAAPDIFYLHDTDSTTGSINVSVTASSDDAEECSGGLMQLDSSDLELVRDDNPLGGSPCETDQEIGMRFLSVAIPQGAYITNAYIEFETDETDTEATNLTFYAEDIDTAPTFTTTSNDITDRTKTTASVAWNSVPAWNTESEKHQTPDLSTIINEVVDRTGWSSGNDLVIIVNGTGQRIAESYDGEPANAPLLHVEYSVLANAGKYMNTTIGAGAATMTFNSTDDDAYWYTDLTYPTGDEDASLVAGDYKLNMYFDQLPTGGADWYNTDWGYRKKITIDDTKVSGTSDLSYFPVLVNFSQPTLTLTRYVIQSSDDAEEGSGGAVDISSSDLELVQEGTSNVQTIGVRFQNITIPQGATITRAYLQFAVDVVSDLNPSNLTLHGELTPSAPTFEAVANNITVGRPNTTASVDWSFPAWASGEQGPNQRTPDISAVVEEIVGQGAWTSGNPLVLIITGEGRREAESWNGANGHLDLTLAPRLTIEYATGSDTSDPDLRDTSNGGYVGQADGGDILFTDSNGTKLDHEIEKYDNTTGELVAWVEVPTLYYNSPTDLYMYYGNATVGDQWNIAGTWDEGGADNYKGVWHLDEDAEGTGTADLYQDSTTHTNHADDRIGFLGQGGQIDGGQEFDGVDDDALVPDPGGAWDFSDGGLDAGTSDFTISAWVSLSSLNTQSFPTILAKGGGSSTSFGYWFNYQVSSDSIDLRVSDGTNRFIANSSATGLSTDDWEYLTVVFDREPATDTAYFYLNGSSVGSESSSLIAGNSASGTQDFAIADSPYWDGSIDEVRIADTTRTSDWIATEFNNQSATSSFYNVYSQETPQSVDIVVSVYHTDAGGGDPQEIVTSSTITIDANTTDPYELDIGSGAEQTFTSADPRRLRVYIEVIAVVGTGSFTLAYDSVADHSSLDTPSMVVPEWGLAFLILVPLFPFLIGMIWRRKRLAANMVTVLLGAIIAISLLSGQVMPTTAAPDVFYLHSDATSGLTPAGEYMNITEGSSGTTKTFSSTGSTYWYADEAWPTGDEDASIAAGDYTFDMYFSSLPDGSGWYDPDWDYRKQITVQSSQVDDNLSNFPVYVDLADLGADFFSNVNADGGDIRITNSDGTTEMAREIVAINTGAQTGELHFKADSLSSVSNTNFYIYYGNSGASDYAYTATYGRNAVWSSNYAAVWHLEEEASGTGTANLYVDSTGNGYDGDDQVSATGQTGRLGNGQELDGLDDFIDMGDVLDYVDPSNFALEAWIRPTIPAAGLAVSGTPSHTTYQAVPSVTFQHTTPSGTNRLMLVGVSFNNNNLETVTSVTYNGDSLTFVGARANSDDARIEIWALVAPDVGTDLDLVVTFSTSPDPILEGGVVGVVNLAGAEQVLPDPVDFVGADATSAGPATVDVTSTSGELVFATVACETCTSLTADGSMSEHWNDNNLNTDFGAGATKAGETTTTMSWTLGSSDHWAIGAIAIAPSATGLDDQMTFIGKWGGTGTDRNYRFEVETDATLTFLPGGGVDPNLNSTTVLTTDTWYHAAVSVNQNSDIIRLRLNGTQEDANLAWTGAIGNGTYNLNLGRRSDVSQWFDGNLDEVRISNGTRLDGWNSTGYNNQNSTTSFYSVDSQEVVPSVDITVYVHHTAADGSDPQLITSASTTIDSSTTDPLFFDVGNDAFGQTFTSADPRVLRLQVEVTAVNGGGSFVLDYDGDCASNQCSSLDTPVVVVPDVTVLLMVVVILIPIVTALLTRKRRVTLRLISFFISLIVAITLLFQQVSPVHAAPDTFYLRDTSNNGASPAGEDMNLDQGSTEDTLVFDEATDEAYWYTEYTYPTGGDDASIASGDYTLNMYFDQLPKSWWDSQFPYRQQITITAGSTDVPANYSVWFDFDHQTLVNENKSLNSGWDVRIVYWNGSGWTELDRLRDDLYPWNQLTTRVWFETQSAISANTSDSDYYLYYGDLTPTAPPDNWANIYLLYDNFNDDVFDETGRWDCTMGTCSESGGFLTLNSNERVFADASYAFGTDTRWEARTRLGGDGTVGYLNYWCASEDDTFSGDWIALWSDDTEHIAENYSGGSTSYNFTPSTPTSYHIYAINREGSSSVRYFQDTTEITNLSANVPTGNLGALIWNDNTGVDQDVDFVRVRNYVSPEPTASVSGDEDSSADVRIIVSVYHTNASGGDLQEIATSSTITIDSNTPLDNYQLDIGTGIEQTFTSADVRRLRVHIDVTAVNGGESFTLAYDSSANPSSLDTPALVVPEWSVVFLFVVLLIPYLMAFIWRRRRLALLLALVMSVVSIQLGVQATEVEAFVDEPDENRMTRYTTPLTGVYKPDDDPEIQNGPQERLDLRDRYSKTSQVFVNGEPTNKFIWDGSVAPIHYQDSQGDWQEIYTDLIPSSRSIPGFGVAAWEMIENEYEIFVRGEIGDGKPLVRFKPKRSGYWVELEPQQLQWTAMSGQSEVIALPGSVQPVVAGDEIVWSGAYGEGVDLRLEVGAGRMHKWLDLTSSMPAPSDNIIQGGEPILEYVEVISYHPGLSIWVDNQEWNEQGVVVTTGEIQFRDPQGKLAFTFPLPSVTETGGKGIVGQYRLMKQDKELHLAVGVTLLWLEGAQFPVSIDPTIDVQVGASTDDCDRWGATDFHCEYASLYLDYNDPNQSDGMHFTGVAIPNGATIDTAYLTVRSRTTVASPTGGATIYGQDHDNPPTFTQGDYAEYDARVRTTANVYWQPSEWVLDNDYNSPEIKTVVQEIVDRPGWSSGNDMVMFFVADQTEEIIAYAYDSSPTYAAKLHIEYSPSKSFVFKVGASSDDCDRDDVNWSTTTTTFYLDWDSVGQADGVRFTNVTVPKGATIVDAYLRVRARDGTTPAGGATIYGQAADDPATFSTAADWNLRTWTTANVSWQPSAWVANTYYNSPDISAVVQEIVDRSGWAAGNAMAFKLDGDELDRIYGYSWDYSSGLYAPELHIEYSMYDSLTVKPGQSSDDFDHDSETWDLTTTYFYLDWDNPARTEQADGLRIPSVAIPAGAVIDQAFFMIRARDTQSSGIGGATIYGQDHDDPPTFSTDAEYHTRTWISSPTIHWEPYPWTAEVWYDSPDVSGIIQAIVDRPGWNSGQAMAFLFDGDEDDNVDGYSWDYNSGQYAPELYIEFTVPPAAPLNCQATFVSDTQIDVSWDDNSYNETGFKIESSVDGGGFSQIDTVGEGEESYSDTSTSADHSYQYQVRATNSAGDSSYCTATSTIYTSPDPPTNVSATHTADLEITLTWTDQSQYEDQFRIERDKNGGGYVFLANDTDGSPFVDSTITQAEYDAGDSFTYRIRSEISSQGRVSAWVYSNTIVVPESSLLLVLMIPLLPVAVRVWSRSAEKRRSSKGKRKMEFESSGNGKNDASVYSRWRSIVEKLVRRSME